MEIKQEAHMESGDLAMVDEMSTLALNLSPHQDHNTLDMYRQHNGGGAPLVMSMVKIEPSVNLVRNSNMNSTQNSQNSQNSQVYLESPSGNKRFRPDNHVNNGWPPPHANTAPPSPAPQHSANGTPSGYNSAGPVTPSNGFPSPLTVSSYDPYSPTTKLCEYTPS
jgi:hypothetical protein